MHSILVLGIIIIYMKPYQILILYVCTQMCVCAAKPRGFKRVQGVTCDIQYTKELIVIYRKLPTTSTTEMKTIIENHQPITPLEIGCAIQSPSNIKSGSFIDKKLNISCNRIFCWCNPKIISRYFHHLHGVLFVFVNKVIKCSIRGIYSTGHTLRYNYPFIS